MRNLLVIVSLQFFLFGLDVSANDLHQEKATAHAEKYVAGLGDLINPDFNSK
jgi:hypothetical protein